MPFINVKLIFILAAVLFLSGCSYHKVIALHPRLPQQRVFAPIPLAIGVYRSAEFVNYIDARKGWSDDMLSPILEFPLGKASSTLFEQVLEAMFATVIPLDASAIGSSRADLAGSIEIKFKGTAWDDNTKIPGVAYSGLTIEYSISVKDERNRLLAVFPISVSSKPRSDQTLIENIEFEMLDAMAKFIVEFRDKPEIIAWLKAHKVNVDSFQ